MLTRLDTILAQTSYRFPKEDSTGVPLPLPEARKIGLGRRSVTGFLTSGRKMEGFGPYESGLERDLFVLLEFRREVVAWHPQPLRIDIPASPGRRATRYTPDVAIEYSDRPTELCEVKYRDELKEKWCELRPLLRAGVKYARAEGWRFKIYTEVEIRTPMLDNARFLLGYTTRGTDADDIFRLSDRLRRLGSASPTSLLNDIGGDAGERGRLLGVLWHMLAKGLVVADLNQKLTMQTPMRIHERHE